MERKNFGSSVAGEDLEDRGGPGCRSKDHLTVARGPDERQD